jgi:hypothetical protein
VDDQGWAAPDTSTPAPPRATPPAVSSAPAGPGRANPPDRVRLPVRLRPMTMPDLLDGSFAVIKARPRTVFTLAAVILVPFHLLTAYIQHDARAGVSLGNLLGTSGSAQTSGSVSGIGFVYLAIGIATLAPFLLGGALGTVVASWYAGGDQSAGDALRAMGRRAPALVLAWLVLLPLKIVSVLACLVPSLVVIPLFALTAPAITVEGLGAIAGARRSWRLVTRRFWPCVGVILVASTGAYVLNLIFGLLPQLLTSLLPAPFDWIGQALVTAAVSLVVETALLSVSVLLYLDLRIRTEGLDLLLTADDAFPRVG